MKFRIRRSLIGYRKRSVEEMVSFLNEQFETKKQQLHERYIGLEAEIKEMRQNIQSKRQLEEKQQQMEKEVYSRLGKAYLNNTKVIIEARKKKYNSSVQRGETEL